MNTPVIHCIDGPVGRIETASLLCDLLQPMPEQAPDLASTSPVWRNNGNKVVTTIARVARDAGSSIG